jgi:uncharacterized membrane protein
MTTVLWATQVLVALLFTVTGTVKLVLPREKLQKRMHWAASWPRARIKLLGLAELLGAAGLILPPATGVLPILTPIAAACLGVLMAGAIHTHRRLGETFAPALVVAILCVVLATVYLVRPA